MLNRTEYRWPDFRCDRISLEQLDISSSLSLSLSLFFSLSLSLRFLLSFFLILSLFLSSNRSSNVSICQKRNEIQSWPKAGVCPGTQDPDLLSETSFSEFLIPICSSAIVHDQFVYVPLSMFNGCSSIRLFGLSEWYYKLQNVKVVRGFIVIYKNVAKIPFSVVRRWIETIFKLYFKHSFLVWNLWAINYFIITLL